MLRRLKAMERLRVTAIRSSFFAGGMRMNVGVEGQDRARLASFSLPLDAYSYAYCNGTWAKLAIRERVEDTKKKWKVLFRFTIDRCIISYLFRLEIWVGYNKRN